MFYRELTLNRLTGENIQTKPGADTEKGFRDTNCQKAVPGRGTGGFHAGNF